jgi:phosphopantetheinyl transferase (holo-ACP synthase)
MAAVMTSEDRKKRRMSKDSKIRALMRQGFTQQEAVAKACAHLTKTTKTPTVNTDGQGKPQTCLTADQTPEQ